MRRLFVLTASLALVVAAPALAAKPNPITEYGKFKPLPITEYKVGGHHRAQ